MTLDREGVPLTAADALELWDKGEPVPAIRVEAEAHTQDEIYAHVFAMLAAGEIPREIDESDTSSGLTLRERQAAHSVAVVAVQKGWQAMLAQHDHPSIAKLTVRKPAEPEPEPPKSSVAGE